ncbi:MAG: phosphoribosylformylglycinamidine cyclo-ligase, partial [Candidatus Zixiibacteriota bacterium]
MAPSEKKNKLSYASAGVDIKAGDDAVEKIKSLARKTFGDSVLSEIGSFGGFFRPNLAGLDSPVLISSADGV